MYKYSRGQLYCGPSPGDPGNMAFSVCVTEYDWDLSRGVPYSVCTMYTCVKQYTDIIIHDAVNIHTGTRIELSFW